MGGGDNAEADAEDERKHREFDRRGEEMQQVAEDPMRGQLDLPRFRGVLSVWDQAI
jgi:hypothetical protein